MTDTKSTFVPTSAGEHEARFVHVIVAGEHTPPNDRFNKGSTPRLYVTYEILDEQNADGKNKWLRGFNYNQPMNNYGGERGGRFDMLAKMGFATNEDEDLKSLVGMQCWVNVTQSEWQGKNYANFAGLNRCSPRDGEFSELGNPAVYFDVYNPVVEDWNNLPKWIKDYCLAADDTDKSGIKEFADEAAKQFKSPTNNGAADKGTVTTAKAAGSGTPKQSSAEVYASLANQQQAEINGSDDDDIPF